MIEDEIRQEIQEEKAEMMEEPEIHWSPVSNIPVDEIYKDLPDVKQFHDSYVKMWNLRTKNKDR